MSNYTVIADVGQTIVDLLKENREALDIDADSIVLCSPADVTNTVRLSLFLYQVTENSYMKNQDMVEMGSNQLQYSSLYLDLFYLLTPHSNADIASRSIEEHKILGKAMNILHDYAVLSGSKLKGGLTGKDEEVRIYMNALSLDDVNKIWSAFTNKQLKLSVGYRVGPIAIESSKSMEIRRVSSVKYEYNIIKMVEDK